MASTEEIKESLEEVVADVKEKSQNVKVSLSTFIKNPLNASKQILNEVKENLPSLELFIKVTWVLAFWEVTKLVYVILS